MLGEEEKKREKVGRRKEIEEGLKKKKEKKKDPSWHPPSTSHSPAFSLSHFLPFCCRA